MFVCLSVCLCLCVCMFLPKDLQLVFLNKVASHRSLEGLKLFQREEPREISPRKKNSPAKKTKIKKMGLRIQLPLPQVPLEASRCVATCRIIYKSKSSIDFTKKSKLTSDNYTIISKYLEMETGKTMFSRQENPKTYKIKILLILLFIQSVYWCQR